MNEDIGVLAKRIEELEQQFAFQDDLHESLNLVVAAQAREILELKQHVKQLSERLKEIGDSAAGAQPQDEIPPHY